MLQEWQNDPGISFAFYAVPKEIGEKNTEARFNIYSYAMVNLFSPRKFKHYMDLRNSLYVLLNTSIRNKKDTIINMGKYMLSQYEMIFEPRRIFKKDLNKMKSSR